MTVRRDLDPLDATAQEPPAPASGLEATVPEATAPDSPACETPEAPPPPATRSGVVRLPSRRRRRDGGPEPDRNPTAFVLDTSVLIHDPGALRSYRGSTVVIPIYVVMELDELKSSRRHEVAMSARATSRFISDLRSMGRLRSDPGVWHPELETHFRVVSDGSSDPFDLAKSTHRRTMDMLILATAFELRDARSYDRVVLVSKDVNLRILADFEGLEAEDYDRDRVELDSLYTGHRFIEPTEHGRARSAFVPGEQLRPEALELEDLEPNEFVVLREGERRVLLRHRASGRLEPVPRHFPLADIEPRNLEQRMALELLLDPTVRLVTLVGKAGTGKTFLALAAALGQLGRSRAVETYERVLLSKPVVAMGRDIGYLPGDFETKMQPWMTSFFDNLDQLIGDGSGGGNGKGAAPPKWEYLFQTNRPRHPGAPLDPRALDLVRLHAHRRGAEPDAPRGEDGDHPGGRGHEDRPRRRPLPGRRPVPGPALQRAGLRDRAACASPRSPVRSSSRRASAASSRSWPRTSSDHAHDPSTRRVGLDPPAGPPYPPDRVQRTNRSAQAHRPRIPSRRDSGPVRP